MDVCATLHLHFVLTFLLHTAYHLDKGLSAVSDDLNPISIRVVDKGNVLQSAPFTLSITKEKTHPHLTLLGPLLEFDTLLIEPLDGSFEIINSHTNMSESFSNIIISRSVSLERIVLFYPLVQTSKWIWGRTSAPVVT